MMLADSIEELQTPQQKLTFERFIKLTQRRQIQKLRQAKYKIYVRKHIKQQSQNRIKILPDSLAIGVRKYQPSPALKYHLQSNRFPVSLSPSQREVSLNRESGKGLRIPHLRRLYRMDQINSVKDIERYDDGFQEEYERGKLKRIRMSLHSHMDYLSVEDKKERNKFRSPKPRKNKKDF